jgi:DNA-binding MarR family transcriptional regulator
MKYAYPPSLFSDGDREHDLYLLIMRTRDTLFQAREKELQKYDLTPEQAFILYFATVMKGTAGPSELARAVLRQRHTVSTLVDRMGKKGLIYKKQDPKYRNRLKIALTPKGRQRFVMTSRREPIHRILGVLDEEERQCLVHCLDKINAAANKVLGMVTIEDRPQCKD